MNKTKKWIAAALIIVMAVMSTACAKQETAEDASADKQEYIGILSAMENEVQLLLAEAEIDHVDTIGGVDFNVGTLKGTPVVIAKAGIGKVLSASGAAVMLDHYDISRLIFTGIAGAVGDETEVLDEVIATRLVQHDYGTYENEGFKWTGGESPGNEGEVIGEDGYYYCDEDLVALAYDAAVEVIGEEHAFKGTIATGDQFIASEEYVNKLKKDHDALACEMEGAAIALVGIQFDTPFVVIRALSDKADGKAHESIENMGDIAADNSSRIVMKMLEDMQ